ncbi:calcineurin-like phosphoesterase C-terminal domain-containing protein [Fodinibius sediminis]|uniref:Calcineurin-like phosphoesterase n=1 Tax=Fodinibius sediminis TaxID=1214077 RepID=A0A521BZD5_9BACT|nr:calcineurin-like phosphoesterase family protein [Fodinibius sediminis]SMO51951.1 Calcineurin-like phosphoesterase [Fodinibius sediminis]
MKLRYFIILVWCIGSIVPEVRAQQMVQGTVFIDLNDNGKQDSGEQGLEDVAVANGQEVVLTDDRGRYTLEIDDQDGQVFVIKPSGYKLPLDEFNRPQFYYLHKPGGSPELNFQGVKPTGPMPESVDFPLLKAEQRSAFSVLLFGDPQPYTEREVTYFDRDIVSELQEAEGYAFGITLGDIVGDDLSLFHPYSQSVEKIGIPWFSVQGNHDMNYDARTDQHADETFEATFGPPTFSFNKGKAHFIILDDIVYPRGGAKSGYVGGLTDKQLSFIENDLKHVPNNHLVVLAFHIPLFTPQDREIFRKSDRQRLFNLLKEYPHTLSLSAHTHIQQFRFFDRNEGWGQLKPHIHYNVGTTNGDWWSGVPDERGIPPTLMRDGTPNGYAILNIKGNFFTIDYKVADKPKEYKMSIWGPKVVPQDSWHGAQLYVNYFLGSEFSQVRYRVKGVDDSWRAMNRVDRADPHVSSLRQKWDEADNILQGRRPSNPVLSTHLWNAGVPNNLPIGEHTIEVQVSDMFGRTFTDEYTYRVIKSGP